MVRVPGLYPVSSGFESLVSYQICRCSIMVITQLCQSWNEGSIPFTYSNECFNEYCFALVVSKQTCRYG